MPRYILTLIIAVIFTVPVNAQGNKAQQRFNQIRTMVDSNRFEILFTIATTHSNYFLQPTTPYLDQNIRIDQDSAFIIIRDTIATGYLPYYGSGYSFPQTGIKGIIFDNVMLNKTIKNRGRGKKQAITYEFAIAGKNDYYKINLDIQYDGTCYLYVNSDRRSPITYSGMIEIKKQ